MSTRELSTFALVLVAALGAPPRPPTASSVILGRVVEGLSETPVADALIGLRARAQPYLALSALTDAEGNFVFLDVPPGSYELDASKTGYWQGSFGQRRPSGRGRLVALIEGQPVADVRVPVWSFAAISGTVVDDAGEPVVGVAVQAMSRYVTGGRAMISSSSPRSVRTDDRGMYRLFALIPGEFLVSIPASESGETAAEASSLTLVSGEERRGIDFRLRTVRTHRVSGRVVGAGAGGITVRLVRADDRFTQDIPVAESMTRADGSFTMSGIPPGNYALRVFDKSGEPGVRGFASAGGGSASAAGAAGVPASDADGQWALMPVTVGDADVPDIQVQLHASLRIAGRFAFNGTTPRPSAADLPRMYPQASQPSGHAITRAGGQNVTVDAAGNFTTAGLPAGRYLVRLLLDVPGGWALESITLNGRDAMDEPVMLEDHDVSGLVITLTDKISEVTGAVQTATGAADLDAAVLLFPANPAGWIDFGVSPPRMRYVRAGVDGRYSVKGAPPGDYLAIAVKDEYAGDWQTQAMLERLSRNATKFTVVAGGKQTVDLRTTQIR